MLNDKILNQMNEIEKSEYEYNNQSFWQASDEYGFKLEDPSGYDSGFLTVGDMRAIKDAQYLMCQKFENQMREKYSYVK